ncbi:MAG: hypothetical protein IH985_09340 [Planctomycetes bacterium]|nr:hypothetical protein [Planctomycetota bacterium]
MPNMWHSLGFRESPYDSRPLKSSPDDAELLVGREQQGIDFCTTLDSSSEGVFVISGAPGVGKTSFFNVQQYRLSTQTAAFGPHLLAAEALCPIHPGDSAGDIAHRVLESLVKSVEIECRSTGARVPHQTATVARWIRSSGQSSGSSFGLSIAGFGGSMGRTVSLPDFSVTSFEGLVDAIEGVVSEIVNTLHFGGCFVVLDNVENLSDDELANLLITFRDTLFCVPRVWWIVIGQSGLQSLIESLDPRVAERLSGAMELTSLDLGEFEDAIRRRVERFSESAQASPLPARIHERLYNVSVGEIRFVLKTSNDVCTRFVSRIRQSVAEQMPESAGDEVVQKAQQSVASYLVNQQIDESSAEAVLRELASEHLNGFNFNSREKTVLSTIFAKGEARPKDFRDYPVPSMQDFSSNYLSRFHRMYLLARRQEGRAVFYRLRGMVLLGAELGLLNAK